MSTEARVMEIPPCDFCKGQGLDVPAKYDGQTTFGLWAYMCGAHYSKFGMGLGTGVGQKLILIKTKEDK